MEKIVNRTHQILKKNEIFAKKKFGQNFLISERVLANTIEKSGIDSNTYVIEIGTGLGSLTEFLALSARHVLTYEIDQDMEDIAKRNLRGYDNITFVLKDFMETNIEEDIKEYLDDALDVVVVANIPYYITTPIAFKVLECERISKMFLMMQAELGARFCASPSTKEYNSLSALISYRGEAKREFNVSRNCFYPVPNVDSILLSIKTIKRDYGLNNSTNFVKFIKNAFSQKRKTLVNNISSTYPKTKEELNSILTSIGFAPTVRSEELDVYNLVKVYKAIFEND